MWLECPTKNEKTDDIELKSLPMFDPHEYLNYLWHHEHLKIEDRELQQLGIILNFSPADYFVFYVSGFGRLKI